jgi:uncharacterized protein (DUF1800 family)
MDNIAAQAMIRFGLGRKGSEPVPSDPRGWLAGQVRSPDAPLPPGLPTSADGLRARIQDFQDKPPPGQGETARLYRTDVSAQLGRLVTTDAPYRERLVTFWANHFTVSRRNGGVGGMACAYVREAIRPHVTGKFHDMLLAVMRHPAMLLYLDNAVSIGPHSPVGLRKGMGLNENLARESLELHTVSPASGYTQADVTSYAAILTGWGIDMRRADPGFAFHPPLHEPGSKTLMGRSFPEGEQGGLEALAFLAAHPATHRHLATKLVRHFVADTPPPDAVARIEGVLRDTNGDLGAASIALTELPEAWSPFAKLRSPEEFAIAVVRAADLPGSDQFNLLGIVTVLGQAPYTAAFPIGWPDTAAEWAGSQEIMSRVDWAYNFGGRAAQHVVPEEIAEAALGPLVKPATLQAIQHAGSRQEALTLLFTSPEFQRR